MPGGLKTGKRRRSESRHRIGYRPSDNSGRAEHQDVREAYPDQRPRIKVLRHTEPESIFGYSSMRTLVRVSACGLSTWREHGSFIVLQLHGADPYHCSNVRPHPTNKRLRVDAYFSNNITIIWI